MITGVTNGTAYATEARAVNARGDGQSAQVGPVTPSASNRRPTARAGEDQTVNAGASVTLSGSGTDPDGDTLTYSWAQLPGGASVDIENSTSASASFIAPSTASTLRFRLTVNDGRGGADTDDVTITVVQPNRPPVANAGSDRTIRGGATVSLNGTRSSDPDGDSLTYSWTKVSGPAVVLREANTATPYFTSPSDFSEDVALEFRLTVSDGNLSDTAEVTITVQAT